VNFPIRGNCQPRTPKHGVREVGTGVYRFPGKARFRTPSLAGSHRPSGSRRPRRRGGNTHHRCCLGNRRGCYSGRCCRSLGIADPARHFPHNRSGRGTRRRSYESYRRLVGRPLWRRSPWLVSTPGEPRRLRFARPQGARHLHLGLCRRRPCSQRRPAKGEDAAATVSCCCLRRGPRQFLAGPEPIL
jgi:hypothetical protein